MGILDSESRTHFSASIERFIAERYSFAHQQQLARSTDGFGRAEWRHYAELGWLALALPEEHGGMGGGAREAALLMDAVGRGLLLEPFLASVILCGGLIAGAGNDAQKAELLPAIAAGDLLMSFAHLDDADEPCRSVMEGTSHRITGQKRRVLQGTAADRLIVSARGEQDKIGLFLLHPEQAGVAVRPYRLIDERMAADMEFTGARAEAMGPPDARPIIAAVMDHGTAAVCAEALGAIAVVNADSLRFVKERHQFGAPIGSFQVIQHRLVDMFIAEQEARAITMAALTALDLSAPDAFLLVSAAKVRVDEAARFIGENAIQLHGGIGMTEELPLGHYFKRLLLLRSLFNGRDWHLDRLAGRTR